jgi:hypothetical protein
MIRRADTTVSDSLGTPEPGVYITVKDDTGALATLYDDAGNLMANPFVSGLGGVFAYNIADGDAGTFTEEYRLNTLESPRRIQSIDLSINSVAMRYASTRSEMAAMTSTTLPVLLTESGRNGVFTWSSSNLSTQVTTDTAQGIYVAPAASTGKAVNGSQGAWVRQFPGSPILPGWFGAIADDDDAATGTNNAAAFTTMFAVQQLRAKTGLPAGNPAIYRGAEEILIVGHFYAGTATIEPLTTFKLRGIGGKGPGSPSRIRFAANTTGLRAQAYNTSGGTTVDGVNHYSGEAFVVEDIYFLGAFTGTEGEYHGVHAKRPIYLTRCTFDNFQGDGYYAHTSSGAGAPNEGSSSESRITDCDFINNRNNIDVSGADANACHFSGCSTRYARAWNVRDFSQLGNTYTAHHSDGGGITNYSAALGASVVSQGGNRYAVKSGQEVGARTNAPSGTTADNTWWYYMAAGGVSGTAIPAWSNNMLIRSGGAYCTDAGSGSGTGECAFYNCYSEGGQGPGQFAYPSRIDSGLHGAGVKGYPIRSYNFQGWFRVGSQTTNRGIYVDGQSEIHVPDGGNLTLASTGSPLLNIDSTTGSYLQFLHSGGVIGYLLSLNGNGLYINHASGLRFRAGGADIAQVLADGFHVTGVGAFSGALSASNLSGTNTGDQYTNLTGLSVVGRSANTSGAAAAITGADGQVLRVSGTTLGFGTIVYAGIQNVAASRLLGNPTGSPAAPSEISLSADLAFSGTSLQVGAFTGDITKSAGSLATTIGNNAVTYAKFQQPAANSIVANPTGSTANAQSVTLAGGLGFSGTTLTINGAVTAATSVAIAGAITSSSASAGIGYATGAGAAVTQTTSRTTGVTINNVCGAITLVSAAGTAAWQSFTVTNSRIAATDTINVSQKSGTDKYMIFVTNVAAGSFQISFATTGGTTTEQPVFNFAVVKAVAA